MSAPTTYPGGMDELRFVETYWQLTLRKPQVGADAALRTMVTAAAVDRMALMGVIGDYVGEAARRLVAVYTALEDRTYPVGTSLAKPLPGREAWDAFAQVALTAEPRMTLRTLSLGEDGLDAAERLRGLGDVGWVGPLISALEAGGLLVEGAGKRGMGKVAFAGTGGERVLVLDEDDAATLADMAAEFSGIGRGFLAAYLEARSYAGQLRE